MISVSEIPASLLHLIFPHVCEGCSSDLLSQSSCLCLRCLSSLSCTEFERSSGNPIEKKFYGRLPLEQATAQYYFAKGSLIQQLVHLVKYKHKRELGLQLGRLMGDSIHKAGRFAVDALVPLPLFPSRERKRGYNQSQLLCDGIAEYLSIPVLNNVITRPQHTETQTQKGRIERWKNIEGKFVLADPNAIEGKHILLVDDVITTGATLEACGSALCATGNTRLSIAALCYTYS